MGDQIPRRVRIDLLTPAETAIYHAHGAVEALPPDPRLTNAGMLLTIARELVADYVDGVTDVVTCNYCKYTFPARIAHAQCACRSSRSPSTRSGRATKSPRFRSA